MSAIRVGRNACRACRVELDVVERRSVEDSDGRSADAIVTKHRCPKCGETYTHWLMPRVGGDRTMWMGDREPAGEIELELLDPWGATTNAADAEAELQREVGAGYTLFGRPLRAVARRADCDDVLFVSTELVCVVHLTWRRAQEPDPRWPSTEVFASVADFVARRMRPDHEDFDA